MLVEWCQDNNLTQDINKTKELIVEYWKQAAVHKHRIHWRRSCRTFRFLGVTLTNNFKWTQHTLTTVKNVQ